MKDQISRVYLDDSEKERFKFITLIIDTLGETMKLKSGQHLSEDQIIQLSKSLSL